MVIKLPTKAGKVPDLKQSDVRETSGVTSKPTIGDFSNAQHNHSNAIGGGQLDHTSCFSAGEGTNTHAQIDTHIANTSDPHNITWAQVNKTTSDIANITTRSHTSLSDVGSNAHSVIDTHLAAANPHTGHVDMTGNETIAGIKTFSSFSITPTAAPATNYQVANKKYVDDNAGGLTNKTSYWSCTGEKFIATNPDTDTMNYYEGTFESNAANLVAFASVELPHGAVITGVKVNGDAQAMTWELIRRALDTSSTGSVVASANINVEDTTISNATVDNSNYRYSLEVVNVDASWNIYGARIKYTTDYD